MEKSTAISLAEYPPIRQPPAGISAADLQHKDFAPIRWVVPDFIPDGLTMLAGKPKLGKSWLVLDVAVAVAKGGATLGNRSVLAGSVLYGALEDNQRRLKSRMAKLVHSGAAWPPALTFWTEMPRLDEGGLQCIANWIDAHADARLVIIDTFAKVRTPKKGSDQVYDADYASAAPLKTLADRTGVAIVVIHHLRKQAADDPLEAVSGSNGLTGAVDTILILNRGSEGVTLYGRGRDIPEIETAMEFDKLGCRWSVLGDAAEVHRSNERKQILEALRAAAPALLTAGDVRDVTGLSYAAARRLLAKMSQDGEVKHPERGKYGAP
jgi:hypothetical protein